MSLKDIVVRRLEEMIFVLKEQTVDINSSSKLGSPPIGFDSVFLQGEFRGHLNGNLIGFADLLQTGITKSEVTVETTVGQLATAILNKSSVTSFNEYEAKMNERVRLGLRKHVALLAQPPISESDVLPHRPISDYVPDSAREQLRAALQEEFRKYLIGGAISKGDLAGSLNAVRDDIVLRMLA
jgi:hypothetical protein